MPLLHRVEADGVIQLQSQLVFVKYSLCYIPTVLFITVLTYQTCYNVSLRTFFGEEFSKNYIPRIFEKLHTNPLFICLHAQYGQLSNDVQCRLFNTYCTHFYGAETWNVREPIFASLCTCWNIAVRTLWDLTKRCPQMIFTRFSSISSHSGSNI